MNKKELMEYQLTRDDFEITMSGVLINYNSHIIKKILNDQRIVKQITKYVNEKHTAIEWKHLPDKIKEIIEDEK